MKGVELYANVRYAVRIEGVIEHRAIGYGPETPGKRAGQTEGKGCYA